MHTTTELVLRLLVACLCGIAIGIERNTRAKEAGIRTHCIVACASALMMIISKYGFFDLVEGSNIFASDVRLDPSRMAQGIVTGVGFLGAGMIYFQRGVVKGLTTAAGVWAVSGIGMAIGAGMYALGICTTILVLILQITLHTKSVFSSKYKNKILKVYGVNELGFQQMATNTFSDMKIILLDVSIKQTDAESFDYSFYIEVPKKIEEEALIHIFDYRSKVEFTQ